MAVRVVTDIGTYLVSIFVRIICFILLTIAPLYWGVNDVIVSCDDVTLSQSK